MELDNNAVQLVNKINKLIKNNSRNQRTFKKRFLFKMNEYKKTKILKINLNKIGFISLQMNTKISRHDWKARILKK